MSSPIVYVDFEQLDGGLDSQLALQCMDQSCTTMVVTKEGAIKWVAAAKETGHKSPRVRLDIVDLPFDVTGQDSKSMEANKNNFMKIFFNFLGGSIPGRDGEANVVEVKEANVKGTGDSAEVGVTIDLPASGTKDVEVVVSKFIKQSFMLDRMVDWNEYVEESKGFAADTTIDTSDVPAFHAFWRAVVGPEAATDGLATATAASFLEGMGILIGKGGVKQSTARCGA